MTWNWIHKLPDTYLVDAETRKQRTEICNDCDYLTNIKVCSKCNCFMPVKTWMKFVSCPLEKWMQTESYQPDHDEQGPLQ